MKDDGKKKLISKCEMLKATDLLYSRRYDEIDAVLLSAREAQIVPESSDANLRKCAVDTTLTWSRYRGNLDLVMAANKNSLHTCNLWKENKLSGIDAVNSVMASWEEQPNQLKQGNILMEEMKKAEVEARKSYAQLKRTFNIV